VQPLLSAVVSLVVLLLQNVVQRLRIRFLLLIILFLRPMDSVLFLVSLVYI
jgi:hypothetical protein